MSFNRIMPTESVEQSLREIYRLELKYNLERYERVKGFWLRWKHLHERFLRKISRFGPDSPVNEAYIELEMSKLLKLRQALLSSAVQYFHPKSAKDSHEAKIFASLWAESDKVWTETIEGEVTRLRRVYVHRQKVRRVLGAYSGH